MAKRCFFVKKKKDKDGRGYGWRSERRRIERTTQREDTAPVCLAGVQYEVNKECEAESGSLKERAHGVTTLIYRAAVMNILP